MHLIGEHGTAVGGLTLLLLLPLVIMPFVLTEIVDTGGGLRRYLCVEGKGVSLQDSAVRGSALRQDGIFIYCLPAQAADEPGPYLSVRLTGKRVCQWIPFVEVADYAVNYLISTVAPTASS